MKPIKPFFILLVLLFISSCATTYITSTWKAPGATPDNYKKVMVIGIIRDADRFVRQRMEEHLVGDLHELGYNAFSAYREYGPKAFEGLNEAAVNEKLSKEGVDAVLTIVMLDKQRERRYVPATVVYTPYVMYHNRFWGYYHSIYTRIESPGYYNVSTRYFWESNLYDLRTNSLLYSVQTQSFNPSSADELGHEYGQQIIQHMVKDNALRRQEGKTMAIVR